MSLVRLPRKIEIKQPLIIIVTISGNYYSSSYGYVTVNNTKYTSNQSLSYTIPPDTAPSITVYCYASGTNYRANCRVTLDGTTVAQGTSSSAASYTFTPDKSYTITLTRTGTTSSRQYWTAAIVSA